MSIEVHGITKNYGEQKAVDNLSFRVGDGEIVGFLGPNGAGKSTCMKILTSFIPPTNGRAKVGGFDVEQESLELRKKVGYLPEHNPLYLDMYVVEFLRFVANVHKISNINERVEAMIDLTGLSRERNKQLGMLSKGYRQRVGLAQAMIHEPEVLILDEPTAGLDPNQLAEIRSLILEIGKDKTVLFSSHIMQEVQALCERVVIINKGKLVADEPIQVLSRKLKDTITIRTSFAQPPSEKVIDKLNQLEKFDQKDGFFDFVFSETEQPELKVFHWAKDEHLDLIHLQRIESSLEDVFQELTKDQ